MKTVKKQVRNAIENYCIIFVVILIVWLGITFIFGDNNEYLIEEICLEHEDQTITTDNFYGYTKEEKIKYCKQKYNGKWTGTECVYTAKSCVKYDTKEYCVKEVSETELIEYVNDNLGIELDYSLGMDEYCTDFEDNGTYEKKYKCYSDKNNDIKWFIEKEYDAFDKVKTRTYYISCP